MIFIVKDIYTTIFSKHRHFREIDDVKRVLKKYNIELKINSPRKLNNE